MHFLIPTKSPGRLPMYLLRAAVLFIFAMGCKKNPPGTPGTGGITGATALLTKETLVGRNAVNNVVESAASLFSYDANDNFTMSQLSDTSYGLDITITTNEITKFTYGNSLISSLTEAIITQTSVVGQAPYGTDDSTYISFYASGSQVNYLISNNKIVTTGVPSPTVTYTMDSALLSYDGNGYISIYDVYEKTKGAPSYTHFYKQTFTYSGTDLAGYVLTNYLIPGQPTTTATYTYNNHYSASPFYSIIPGILIQSNNDVSGISEIQTGVNAGSTVYTYNSSYNASNQPVLSTVAVAMTPSNASFPVTETLNYYYQ
jgi:hypothetical protein